MLFTEVARPEACYLHFSLLSVFTEQLLPLHSAGMLVEATLRLHLLSFVVVPDASCTSSCILVQALVAALERLKEPPEMCGNIICQCRMCRHVPSFRL